MKVRARVRVRVRVGVRACHAVGGGRRGRRLGGGGAARVMWLVAAERVEEEVHVLEGQVRARGDEQRLRVHLRDIGEM